MALGKLVLTVATVGQAAPPAVYELPVPSEGLSYLWIVQSIKENAAVDEEQLLHIVDLKYMDDEHDLITFSSQHEVLEAVAVAEAGLQTEFRVFATVVADDEAKSSAPASEKVTEEQKTEAEASSDLPSLFQDFIAYVQSLSIRARDSVSDALQVLVQELKDKVHPKEAVLHLFALLPESDAVHISKLMEKVKKLTAEQWKFVQEQVNRVSAETWSFIEVNIPNWMNMLNLFAARVAGFGSGARGFSFPPFASMFGDAAPAVEKSSAGEVNLEVVPLEDEIHLAEPGSHIIRTWRIKNVGSSTVPEGVQLRAVEDPNNLSSDTVGVVTLPLIRPGETVEISQLLQAPSIEGTYNIVYAFKTLYGQGPQIGPKVPVEILVTEAF